MSTTALFNKKSCTVGILSTTIIFAAATGCSPSSQQTQKPAAAQQSARPSTEPKPQALEMPPTSDSEEILKRLDLTSSPRREWKVDTRKDVLLIAVGGEKAPLAWLTFRAQYDNTTLWPVIIGDEDAVKTMDPATNADSTSSPRESLSLAGKVDPADWFAARCKENAEDERGGFPEADWPAAAELCPGFFATRDALSNRPHQQVYLALVQTKDFTKVPAILRFGDWNACPRPEIHVALLRYWRDKYGAELVSLAGDILECRVSKRPQTREEALTLAKEQYAYCSDIVDQGVGSIQALAASLQISDFWYFWWD